MMNIEEQFEIARRLDSMYSVEEADKWMKSPHPQLEGRRPVDCSYSEVAAIIDRLDSGAYL